MTEGTHGTPWVGGDPGTGDKLQLIADIYLGGVKVSVEATASRSGVKEAKQGKTH